MFHLPVAQTHTPLALLKQKVVDDQKLSQYTQGTVRKSKREKEKEREEAKRREEEELAAKTYAEFLDDFEGNTARKKGSGFVRASAAGASDNLEYNPRGRGQRDLGTRAFYDDDSPRQPSPPVAPAPKPKGKRAMDDFLEVIKKEQAERERRLARSSQAQGRSVTALAAYEGQSGSKDRGDPLTSNIFVANLPQNVNETSLGNFFASRCGPVGSVKIMWPRGDATLGPGADITATRAKRAGGLSGFVSFMKRKDAETAIREIDGFDWGGSILRVGWSKAVPMAAKPAYAIYPGSRSRSRSRSNDRARGRSRSYSPDRYRSRSHSRSRGFKRPRSYSRNWSRSRSRARYHKSRSRSRSPSYVRARRDSRSRSRGRHRSYSPTGPGRIGVDPDTEKFIRTVALKVKDNGEKFEDLLRERERQNAKFRFLFDPSTPENLLYRSLVNGESILEGFDDEGYNSIYSTDSAEDSERERVRKTKLGKLARRRFEAMLRALSGKRGELARCMAFSLEHAEAASEVSDIIVSSLLVDGTPVPRKVARLHLICDILHNSAVTLPSAWKFRQEFQPRLGIVFDHLSGIYHSFPGRITAETFKKQITAVLDVWEDWIVFPPEYIEALRSRLDGTINTEMKDEEETNEETEARNETPVFTAKFKTSAFKPAEVVQEDAPATKARSAAEDEDGEADMDTDSDAEEQVKPDASAEDVDGVPIDDVDGEPIDGDPIDGDPLDGDPIDGMPIDDVDGEPIADDDAKSCETAS
ncbi:uncharacterized protein FOMMEDRAFT_107807 [Fomitiporia mediterranea MF3/22]|uniref:uncharacterized protein n=1 Tax=Fomitiporia mediterranea (strain MF3/22) TaxID=694068 RepID=UPI0004407A93|nr:uncharacterized protein FOMMEDRAFT_107807 [Fomitiporia mediterranea MF3/22]EJD02812.1 hypothetical protein FOMMEDRAFT_107807 [Fomitiporia mediterranea MF3/22]